MRALKGVPIRERLGLFSVLSPLSGSVVRIATVHDYDLSPLSEMKLAAGDGSLLVDVGAPQGGYVVPRK